MLLDEPDKPAIEQQVEDFDQRVASRLLRVELRRVGAREGVLERAEEIVRHSNLPCKPVMEKARQISEGVIRLAKEEAADLIVIGIHPMIGLPDRIMGRTSEAILRKAPCEVVLDRRVE